jgi:hypothetical protein
MSRKHKPLETKTSTKNIDIAHDKVFTLLGSIIIFATFVAKEGIGESYKDLVSGIDSATQLYSIRLDSAFGINGGRSLPETNPETGPTRQEEKRYIDYWNNQSEAIVDVGLELATSLSHEQEEAFKTVGGNIRGEVWQISTDAFNVRGSSAAPHTEAEMNASMKALYDRSWKNFGVANKMRLDVMSAAKEIKDRRQKRYNTAKWASYILFTLGTLLTIYGQISGDPPRAQNG